ncbi:MAG: FAD-binding oxidoreductase, partial [Pyrinomonadaceae bacterium]
MNILNVSQVISGWGRYPVTKAVLFRPEHLRDVTFSNDSTLICRGEGRSYGDAAISSQGLVLVTGGLRRLCRFDASAGLLVAEAGMTISDILRTFVPHGWFPAVTPGTKQVSLGGAVAADVHGKNHHRDGSIGNHVSELEMILADGSRIHCGPNHNTDLFWATVGGMGLTGMITKVTVQLIPIETAYILAQHFKAPDLETAFRWLEDNEHDDQYTVAWIDCLSRGRSLGRSIVMRGRHARRDEIPTRKRYALSVKTRDAYHIPLDFPSYVLNPLSVAVFNHLYYITQGRKSKPFLVDYDRFFYPLDIFGNWNRMYGKRGFLQYQFMIRDKGAGEGMRRILERLARSRRASFLAVLKRFGPGNASPLSFPDKGYT